MIGIQINSQDFNFENRLFECFKNDQLSEEELYILGNYFYEVNNTREAKWCFSKCAKYKDSLNLFREIRLNEHRNAYLSHPNDKSSLLLWLSMLYSMSTGDAFTSEIKLDKSELAYEPAKEELEKEIEILYERVLKEYDSGSYKLALEYINLIQKYYPSYKEIIQIKQECITGLTEEKTKQSK